MSKKEQFLIEEIKKAIVDFVNREYDNNEIVEDFDKNYPNLQDISLAFTETGVLNEHTVQFSLDLENLKYITYFDDKPITIINLLETETRENALQQILNDLKFADFESLIDIDHEDLYNVLGIEMDEDGEFVQTRKIG